MSFYPFLYYFIRFHQVISISSGSESALMLWQQLGECLVCKLHAFLSGSLWICWGEISFEKSSDSRSSSSGFWPVQSEFSALWSPSVWTLSFEIQEWIWYITLSQGQICSDRSVETPTRTESEFTLMKRSLLWSRVCPLGVNFRLFSVRSHSENLRRRVWQRTLRWYGNSREGRNSSNGKLKHYRNRRKNVKRANCARRSRSLTRLVSRIKLLNWKTATRRRRGSLLKWSRLKIAGRLRLAVSPLFYTFTTEGATIPIIVKMRQRLGIAPRAKIRVIRCAAFAKLGGRVAV